MPDTSTSRANGYETHIAGVLFSMRFTDIKETIVSNYRPGWFYGVPSLWIPQPARRADGGSDETDRLHMAVERVEGGPVQANCINPLDTKEELVAGLVPLMEACPVVKEPANLSPQKMV
jgi:hypothetical protein